MSRPLRLEILEDRAGPADLPAPALAAPPPPVLAESHLVGVVSTEPAPVLVCVIESAEPSVIDLADVFSRANGLRVEDGLKMVVLSNTDSSLVLPEMSGSHLQLSYLADRAGAATVIVCATDRDGVSVKLSVLVTVQTAPRVTP